MGYALAVVWFMCVRHTDQVKLNMLLHAGTKQENEREHES